MTTDTLLRTRSKAKCELCGAGDGLGVHQLAPYEDGAPETCILACETCRAQIEPSATLDVRHWRCLNEAAWSEIPAVQVAAWRLLNRLGGESWARDLLDAIYLDDETLAWAKAGVAANVEDRSSVVHKDAHGAALSSGDTVTLIKDLKVKGTSFTAKRGTAVRNISLVHDDASQIEGQVNDQRIVLLTEFVKKSA
jgi:protein PhnA